MEIKIIFYSYTGITRGGVAQKIQRACGGGDLVEVKTVKPYSALTAYSMGCYRAMRGGESDPIEPSVIDVSTSDLIVIGTPVWAFRAPSRHKRGGRGTLRVRRKIGHTLCDLRGGTGKKYPLVPYRSTRCKGCAGQRRVCVRQKRGGEPPRED